MALALTVETSFGGNEMQLARLADYLNAISPCVEKEPRALPLFVESLTITAVALHSELVGLESGPLVSLEYSEVKDDVEGSHINRRRPDSVFAE